MRFAPIFAVAFSLVGQIYAAPIVASGLSARSDTAIGLEPRALAIDVESLDTRANKKPDTSKAPVSPPDQLPDPVSSGKPTGDKNQDAANLVGAAAGEIVKDGGIFQDAAKQNLGDAAKNPKNAGNDVAALQDQAGFQFADIINDGANLASEAAADSVANGSATPNKGKPSTSSGKSSSKGN